MAKTWYEYSYASRKALRHKIYMILVFIILLIVLQTLISQYIAYSIILTSDSMNPEFVKNDCLMITPLHVSKEKDAEPLKRSTVVMLNPQYNQDISIFANIIDTVVRFFTFQQITLFTDKSAATVPLVRRIIGIPGDSIYIDNFIVYIKPQGSSYFLTEFELTATPYDVYITSLGENWNTSIPFSGTMKEIQLGEGEYFVLSDNRMEYADSRLWGIIPSDRISGKVLFRYFPFNALSFL